MINRNSKFNQRRTLMVNVESLSLYELDILKRVAPVLDLQIDNEQGINLVAKKISAPGIRLQYDVNRDLIDIEYFDTTSFARALSHIREAVQVPRPIHETPSFDDLGFMVDLSRNAVLSVESLKLLINYLASMGFNTLYLYIEDTYEIDNYPYFGYQRGAYTAEDLQEVDEYANLMGLEVVPCIQTLGHLANTLKWPYANVIKDTDAVLLVGEEKTYDLIRSMFQTLSRIFRSKRIHLGMDEAFDLGRGRYLDLNGEEEGYKIFSKHIKKVLEITKEFDYEPMIWSDMYFRFASPDHNYLDVVSPLTQELKDSIPNDLSLVYWDYYSQDQELYSKMLERHLELVNDDVDRIYFAGGVWNWNGIKVNQGKMFVTTELALKACKDRGVKRVFATAWSDNGAETSVFEALLGAQCFAESNWQEEMPTRFEVMRRFTLTVGADAEAYYNMRLFDEVPGVAKDNPTCVNPSKYILYNDPLNGLFDAHILPLADHLIEHYGELADYYDIKSEQVDDQHRLFYLQSAQLADVLQRKVQLTASLRSAYLAGDKQILEQIVEFDLPELIGAVADLQAFTMSIWYLYNRPQGSEIIDARFGVLIARLRTTLDRIDGYLKGVYEYLPELEAKRLPFDGRSLAEVEKNPHIQENQWHKIVSANPL